MATEEKKIDLKKIIADKNPRLARVLPSFIVNKIRKIIHEDDVNSFLNMHGTKLDHVFVKEVINEFNVNVASVNENYVPKSGAAIIAANHPLGGLDAMALINILENKALRKDVKFIVNDILLQLTNLKNLFVGVNKHGKNSSEMLSQIDGTYSSENLTLIFPAGLVSRKQKGAIKDLDWKKSFVSQAKKHERDIIPVYIDAKNSNWFYNLALWRKRLGIGANIEMLYLVSEMYHQRNKTITIIFGKPIPHSLLDKSHTDHQWAEKIKEHVYALKSGDKTKLLIQ
jgi:putative hemolysin